ncbi:MULTISPECIES: hypothetical protein [Burkholderia]|uniref:hypothetical protein n=1 Tax=Burkholderia TaxID=32008 RepID=UPI000C0070D5|nr:hypothetical protein [Burkholderia sp. JKS000303]PFH12864.1 hypothetical protein BX604_7284 [Burkholderia sp. JKS000303]
MTNATDRFRNRPMTVRVFTLCTRCSTLRDDVEMRTVYMLDGKRTVESCASCYRQVLADITALCLG